MAEAEKKAAEKKTAEKAEVKKSLTKNQIIAEIAEATKLSKKDVDLVLEAFGEEIKKSMGKKGSGIFTLPGFFKIEKKYVKAKPAQKGVKNSLTGEISDRKAKPAHYTVKVRALKGLKEMV